MGTDDRSPGRVSRRRLLRGAGSCACLLPTLAPARAHAAPGSVSVEAALRELDELSAALRSASLDGVGWQARVPQLLAEVDVEQLRGSLALDWASIAAATRDRGRSGHRLEASELLGAPADRRFAAKLFSLRRGHAIVPHGHRNIVSAFMVLDGRAHGRHYDRVRDEPDAIVIRPTDDRRFAPGDCAAISDRVDNVHWFTALDDQVLLFNVSVTIPERLRSFTGSTGRVYLDPEGEELEGGLIRAPRATRSALRAKYDG